ncbi:CAP domain-containing protein [Methylocystis hirsuta]|uniref:CAP domain-containing protein n=1 Tax=Methylocystis hirsuta TaxID=369798 RepID=A0A3M9XTQ6_9HYPH|nr:CAP domain-containing protein [Methylocystis hirsuta]RNJ51653.1 CAP domain-containing protein [Methylocystis hirsuta]
MRLMFSSPRPRVAILLAFGALAGCNAGQEPATRATGPEPPMYRSLAAAGARVDPVTARDMISLYRRNSGLGALTLDDGLQRVAETQAQSGDLAARGELGDRLAGAGVQTPAAVENVSAGYHTLAEAFSGWRDSAPHNARMLDQRVKRMGIATAFAPGAKYKVYWALVLAD